MSESPELAALRAQIAALEERIRQLESRPVYVPVPYYPPQPAPTLAPNTTPWPQPPWIVTCKNDNRFSS